MLVVHVLILKLLHHDLRNRLKTPASVFKRADIGRQLGKLFDMSFFLRCANSFTVNKSSDFGVVGSKNTKLGT